MSPEKKKGATSKPQPEPATPLASGSSEGSGQPATETKKERKPWIKKTPVEHVLEQIGKQEEKVAAMREELKKEERELAKLQQAKKLLEGT